MTTPDEPDTSRSFGSRLLSAADQWASRPVTGLAVIALAGSWITISVIACSGLSPAGERVFEKIARMADGQMMHLTYTRVARATDGRKYSVLSEGGRTWVADRELDDSEWKKGGEALAKEGKVRAAAAPPAEAIMAAPAKNNLDAEIARGVRAKAEKLGVGY